jgi:hypothetical protein
LVNVSDWIFESFECAKLKHADVNQFAADGASNAIGSVSEYESADGASNAIGSVSEYESSCKLPTKMMCTLMYATLIRINTLVGMLQAPSNLLNQSTQHLGKS